MKKDFDIDKPITSRGFRDATIPPILIEDWRIRDTVHLAGYHHDLDGEVTRYDTVIRGDLVISK